MRPTQPKSVTAHRRVPNILLGDRGTCAWAACPRLLPVLGSGPAEIRTLYRYATQYEIDKPRRNVDSVISRVWLMCFYVCLFDLEGVLVGHSSIASLFKWDVSHISAPLQYFCWQACRAISLQQESFLFCLSVSSSIRALKAK